MEQNRSDVFMIDTGKVDPRITTVTVGGIRQHETEESRVKITIQGSPKEIAALVFAVQERHDRPIVMNVSSGIINASLEAREKGALVNDELSVAPKASDATENLD